MWKSKNFSRVISVICFMLVCGVTYGAWWEDFSKTKESGVGSAWLKLNPGARGVALGDAYLSIAKGPEAIFWNPAGIGKAL